jgi:predicted GNAT family acetyltransferase
MKNNQNLSRFELESQGHIAFANYRLEKNILFIDYVFAPEELRGTGIAGKLMEEICVFVREKNLKIKPICGYAVVWLKKHKEHHDLVEEV